jgi:CheY-like chemotaxis protein
MPAALMGDAGRLRQVLDNLVSNAVKFTAAGEIVIRARCLERLDDAARMLWEVCDTGIGVPADRLGHLFVEFVQADRFRAALQRLGRPMRVLLAEDNPTNQFVVKLLLRGFDVALDMVADGRAAMQAASETPYDAICMDMLMPEMDGLQAIRASRRLSGTAGSLPIIALSANAFPEDVKACMEAGMTHFAAKPVSREALLQVLENTLSAPRDPRLARAA